MTLESDDESGPEQPSANVGVPRKKRLRTTPERLEILCKVFDSEPIPSIKTREKLSEKLGMSTRAIKVWFQNRCTKSEFRRAKVKLELKLLIAHSESSAESVRPRNDSNGAPLIPSNVLYQEVKPPLNHTVPLYSNHSQTMHSNHSETKPQLRSSHSVEALGSQSRLSHKHSYESLNRLRHQSSYDSLNSLNRPINPKIPHSSHIADTYADWSFVNLQSNAFHCPSDTVSMTSEGLTSCYSDVGSPYIRSNQLTDINLLNLGLTDSFCSMLESPLIGTGRITPPEKQRSFLTLEELDKLAFTPPQVLMPPSQITPHTGVHSSISESTLLPLDPILNHFDWNVPLQNPYAQSLHQFGHGWKQSDKLSNVFELEGCESDPE